MKYTLGNVTLLCLVLMAGCRSLETEPRWSDARQPIWIDVFGYGPEDVVPIEIGPYGYPYIPVSVSGDSLMLAFDTGNMVGVSLSSELFDRLGLRSDGTWTSLSSAGEARGTYRFADGVGVARPGGEQRLTRVYESGLPADLAGLFGPGDLGGRRFTVDYRSRSLAVSTEVGPEVVPGYLAIPLVRSDRHPRLILVRGTIEEHPVVIQLDTGKSRTVVNPDLARVLGLTHVPHGVAIRSLRIGNLEFSIRSAKVVDQTAIDAELPEPILVGVGSDILSRFPWTVDYDAGLLWIPTLKADDLGEEHVRVYRGTPAGAGRP
jgi:hypothetical protein